MAIIVGSTRPGRKADTVARWVHDIAAQRDDATFEVVDLSDYALPHLDEPVPPRSGQYTHPHTRAWAQKISSFDAFDFLYAEWNGKAAGFVGYGIQGGIRAVEHLRQVLRDLAVAGIRSTVALTFADDFQDHTHFTPRDPQPKNVTTMLDELVARARELG
jgi:NAD(P)H-dependent FMN reductase